jgi:hypothetical protein
MDIRDYSPRGGRETVAARRNNTLAYLWPDYRRRQPQRRGRHVRDVTVHALRPNRSPSAAAALLLAVVMGWVRRISADRLARRGCRTGIRAPRYFVLSVAEELRVAHQEIREIAVIKVARF